MAARPLAETCSSNERLLHPCQANVGQHALNIQATRLDTNQRSVDGIEGSEGNPSPAVGLGSNIRMGCSRTRRSSAAVVESGIPSPRGAHGPGSLVAW